MTHSESPDPHHHSGSAHTKPSEAFLSLTQEIEQMPVAENKLERIIHFMRVAISQQGIPHFKDFWDAKHLALELFKLQINPSVRVHLWTEYSEICQEMRSLKELLDEQSSFAYEQIEMAIHALEEDIIHYQERLQSMLEPDFEVIAETIEKNLPTYRLLQKELTLLNAYASRISTLRKELIRTEMRLKLKNSLFHRLSHLGDFLFPKRKDKMKEVSDLFRKDIECFIQNTFVGDMRTAALFDVKEEIKALQGIAKVLTLNTETFSSTRADLSQCWDSVREVVTERKKVASELKGQFRQQREDISQQIQQLQEAFQKGEKSSQDAQYEIESLLKHLRSLHLPKGDVQLIRQEISAMQEGVQKKLSDEEAKRRQEQHLKEQQRLQKLDGIYKQLQELQLRESVEKFEEEFNTLRKELNALQLTKAEKLEVEKLVRKCQDSRAQCAEKQLLLSGADGTAALQQVLTERKKRRSEVKAEIESLRKMAGGANLGFSQAIEVQEMLKQEKERLVLIEEGIREIEDKVKSQ